MKLVTSFGLEERSLLSNLQVAGFGLITLSWGGLIDGWPNPNTVWTVPLVFGAFWLMFGKVKEEKKDEG